MLQFAYSVYYKFVKSIMMMELSITAVQSTDGVNQYCLYYKRKIYYTTAKITVTNTDEDTNIYIITKINSTVNKQQKSFK